MADFTFEIILSHLLAATRWTIALSLIAFVSGGLVGLLLLFCRVSRMRPLEAFTKTYIEFFQGTPLLMQLFLFFFGIALFGVEVSPWIAAWLALTFWTSAFLTEIWRGCVEALPRGQWEASASLALSYIEQMRYVIPPQALRIAIPPTVGFSVQVIKGTALASIIGFVELTKAGTMLNNATFRPFLVYSLVGLIYFCLCYPLSWYAKKLEGRLNVAGWHQECAKKLRQSRSAQGRFH
jgi:polar amino acid transport system permease protein